MHRGTEVFMIGAELSALWRDAISRSACTPKLWSWAISRFSMSAIPRFVEKLKTESTKNIVSLADLSAEMIAELSLEQRTCSHSADRKCLRYIANFKTPVWRATLAATFAPGYFVAP